MVTSTRTQNRYDHRLRQLVQTTQDMSYAVQCGVPRSTARGWLSVPTVKVVTLDSLNTDASQLFHLREGRECLIGDAAAPYIEIAQRLQLNKRPHTSVRDSGSFQIESPQCLEVYKVFQPRVADVRAGRPQLREFWERGHIRQCIVIDARDTGQIGPNNMATPVDPKYVLLHIPVNQGEERCDRGPLGRTHIVRDWCSSLR